MLLNPDLQGEPFFLQAGPLGVLLVHGFTATAAEVRPLADRLHSAGYSVTAPLLPGHNTDPKDLNRVNWQDWVAEVEKSYHFLASICERIVVGGESAGGLLSLYLASKHPEIEALLLYAPALRLNMRPLDRIRLQIASPFIPWVSKPDSDPNPFWQGYPVNPLRGVVQLLRLQDQVLPNLGIIDQPILIVQGRHDKTVHPDVPELIYEQVSSKIKEKYWMPESGHCVIIDDEFEQVVEISLSFLRRIFD